MRVYADMVADLFHHGHVEFLKQARDLGGYLIVGVAGDDDAADGKRPPILKVEERTKVMAACRYVDEVIPNAPWRIDASWIAQHNIDIVVHGDDYDKKELDDYYRVPIEMGIFRTVPYSYGISTTEIILRCKEADLGSKKLPNSTRPVWQKKEVQI